MATELIKQIWCDQCLAKNIRRPGTEEVARIIHDGRILVIDGCPEEHSDPHISEVIKFGHPAEISRSHRQRKTGAGAAAPPKKDNGRKQRKLMICSICGPTGKRVVDGSGAKLHAAAHLRHGEGEPVFTPANE